MDTSGKLIFDSLVEYYRQPLAAAAYHLCGDRDAAQDIVQDTLLDAYRGFDSLREPDRAGSWLYAILRRKVIAHRRARKTETQLAFEPELPSSNNAESQVREIILDQMMRLHSSDREILAGKYLLGLSYKELADILGIREGAIRVRCLRAKEHLREVLRGAGVDVRGDKHGL